MVIEYRMNPIGSDTREILRMKVNPMEINKGKTFYSVSEIDPNPCVGK